MGGGDLNMKKSWHPLLMVNQERVWKAEKQALEERKKLEELKRERDQEREMQELQRMQEQAGGKKRQEKVDWMYATPSAGGGPSANELEDYLLGKKRVDKLFQASAAEETSKLTKSGDEKSFIAIQNANTAQDLASKIREDPLLAIKRQEQAAYEALLKDPTRLRELRKAHGLEDPTEDKDARRKRKEEKRREKEERRAARHGRSTRDRSYSPERSARPRDDRRRPEEERRRAESDANRRRPSHADDERRRYEDDWRRGEHDVRPDSDRASGSRRTYEHRDRDRSSPHRDAPSYRPRSPPRSSHDSYRDQQRPYERRLSPPRATSERFTSRPAAAETEKEEAAAKLARMMGNAQAVSSERAQMISRVNEEEKRELEREEALRQKARERYGKHGKSGIQGDFLVGQQSKLTMGSEMDLAERMARGRQGLQRFEAD